MESQCKKAISVSLVLLVFGYRVGITSAEELRHDSSYAPAFRIRQNESVAIGDSHALISSLEMYRSVKHSYPDAWQTDMYPPSGPAYGPANFNLDIQSTAQLLRGYRYRYTPMPPGCSEPNCSGFVVTVIPERPGIIVKSPTPDEEARVTDQIKAKYGAPSKLSREQLKKCWEELQEALSPLYTIEPPETTGTRSFFADGSGKVRHCKGGTGANASDVPVFKNPLGFVEQNPKPCQ